MNGWYDTMQVCTKWGHKITIYYESSPNHRQKRCDKCGSETMIACLNCGKKIRGRYHVSNVIDMTNINVPLNCYNCGDSYPWKYQLLIKNGLLTITSSLKNLIDSFIKIFKN